jgi:L-asparagine oxygenase
MGDALPSSAAVSATYPPLSPQSVFVLDEADSASLWEVLQAKSYDPYASPASLERFLVEAATVVQAFPPELVRALVRFRTYGSPDEALVVRNLLPPTADHGPTPDHWSLKAQHKPSFESELCLAAVTTLLGDLFSFNSEHEGNLIQNIVPQQGDPFAQTTYGSATFLEWHVEHAFADMRCDYAALLCLRGHPEAATTIAPVRAIPIDEPHRTVLFEPRYLVGPDDEQECGAVEHGPVAVLTGSPEDPFLRLDPLFMRPCDPADGAAEAALAHIAERVPAAARHHVLEPGDLLVFDNRRVVHGRTAYTARYDGTDRWLQKGFVSCSLRRMLVRSRGSRVIDPLEWNRIPVPD